MNQLDMENLKMGRYSSQSRMLLLSTLLICVLIIALGVVLGIKLYGDDSSDNDNKNTISGEAGSEGGSTTPATPYRTTPSPTIVTTTAPFTSESVEGHYRYAAVASDAGPCSTIGSDILARHGGTVVDATISSLLCQCVYNIHSCGIGGGFFMTVYNRANKTAYAIIAREMAPAQASETMYTNRSSTLGGLAIGIPGEIKGLWLAHQIGGKLPWKDLLQPIIKLCREGIVVGIPVAYAMSVQTETIKTQLGLRDLIVNKATGEFFKAGEIIKMPKLARTFEIIADEGVDAFYNGSLTKDIVADIQDNGGIITEDDLANYIAIKKDPLMIKLDDNQTVYSPPPPSSGAVYQFILNILSGYKLGKECMSTEAKEIMTWHRIVEAFKFAYAKRTDLGDGDGEGDAFRQELNELVKNMTSTTFGNEIRSQIWDNQTHDTNYYGPTFYDDLKTGTAHLSVLAPNGDAVSVTSTINLYFGSKVVGNRTGIIFNNEMDDFSTPITINAFGVPASPANFIKPGKRPLSAMCPSIVVNSDGMVNLVVGAAGGTKITTSSALVTLETLWLKLGIKEAIDHRRLHHQLLPPYITVEKGFPQAILDGLVRLGHNISLSDSAGSVVQGILQRQEGTITANSDFRKHGYPDGY